jgi:hypothetical protein
MVWGLNLAPLLWLGFYELLSAHVACCFPLRPFEKASNIMSMVVPLVRQSAVLLTHASYHRDED